MMHLRRSELSWCSSTLCKYCKYLQKLVIKMKCWQDYVYREVSRHSGILGQETFVQAVPPWHRKHTTKSHHRCSEKVIFLFTEILSKLQLQLESEEISMYESVSVVYLYPASILCSKSGVHAAIMRVAGITRTRIWGRSVKFKQIIVLTMSVFANKQFDYAVLLSLNMEVVAKIQVLEFC